MERAQHHHVRRHPPQLHHEPAKRPPGQSALYTVPSMWGTPGQSALFTVPSMWGTPGQSALFTVPFMCRTPGVVGKCFSLQMLCLTIVHVRKSRSGLNTCISCSRAHPFPFWDAPVVFSLTHIFNLRLDDWSEVAQIVVIVDLVTPSGPDMNFLCRKHTFISRPRYPLYITC